MAYLYMFIAGAWYWIARDVAVPSSERPGYRRLALEALCLVVGILWPLSVTISLARSEKLYYRGPQWCAKPFAWHWAPYPIYGMRYAGLTVAGHSLLYSDHMMDEQRAVS